MSKIPRSFYCRDTEIVAQKLLGKKLVHIVRGQKISGIIVETEAYIGAHDKACHGYNHRRTQRTEVMFGPGGSIYVFLIYGMYHCFNIVTGKKEEPTAVLVRALQPVDGIDFMVQRRSKTSRGFVSSPAGLSQKQLINLTNGPGKLCTALGINKSLNGELVTSSELYLEEGITVKKSEIQTSPRIGVAYAQECADWHLRYFIKGNPYVS